MKFFYSLIALFLFSILLPEVSAQVTAGDCATAVNICTNASFMVAPNGYGNIEEFTISSSVSNPQSNPQSSNFGCLLAGELNSTWMIVNIATSGLLEFSFGQDGGSHCYDWIMWPYTSNTCSQIQANMLSPIRCNWNSPCEAFTGIANTLPPGGEPGNFEPALNVTCGQQFIICFSNYSSATTSVPLNFFGSASVSCSTFTPITVNNATICPGGTATLTANGGNTYSWNTGQTTQSIAVSPSSTTSYTVTGTGPCGSGTATAVVTVLPANDPSCGCTVSANNNGPLCVGATLNLSASTVTGAVSYSWTGPNGFTSNSQNPSIPNITAAGAGTYTVTVNTGSQTCTASTTVTVNPLPTPTAGNNGPLCTTNTLNLTSSGGGSYSWTGPGGFSSTQQNPSIPNITVANGGTYTVTVTSASGCTATASTTVTINPNLVVSASSNAPVCVGATLTLSTAGGTSYSWVGPGGFTSTQQNPSIPNATTGNSGTYTVTVTNASGCTGTASTTVTVNPLPTPSIMGTNTICAGQSTTLTASGGGTYQWNTGATTAGITVSPGTSTTYTVTVSSAAGCTASSSQLVTVNPPPTPTAGNNGPLCTTNTLNLTSSGGGSYSWTGPGGFSSTQQNPSIPNITVANGGTYTVTVTSASGCTATASTTVTINPNLVVSASSNAPVCVGATLTLSTAGGTSYSWVGPGGFTSTQQNPSIPNATTGNSGTYTVTVTNASGCTGTASTTVTVNPLPTPSIMGINTICAGQSTTLTASGGGTYQWNTGATTAGITVSPGTSTTYTVTVSSAAGCTASSSQLVTVNPLPTPTAGNNGPLCTTNTLNLTSSGGGSYSWTGPGGFSSTQQNPSIPNITVANGGTYTVTVTSASGCTATASTTVTINPNLVVSASSNAPVCVGATLTLSTAGGTSYSWVGHGGFTSTQQNPSIPNATTGNSGTYTVTVTNASGCTGTASTTVTVNPLPTPSIMGTNTICAGQSTTLTASGGGTYQWNTGATTAGITVSPGTSTTYTVTVSSAAGCTASSSQLVTVNPLPTPTAGNNGPLCTTNTLNLTSSGGGSYSWTGPGGFSSTQQNPSIPNITVANGGTYTVTVTDVNGCTASVSTMVVVNALPMVVAGSSGMACEGLSINLTSSGGTSYSWVGPNGFASNMQNPVLNTIDVTHAGVYTVTVTNAEGCTASSTVSVVVNPLPQANYTAVNLQGCSPVCTDFSDLSTVSSGSVTSWSWSANGTLFSNAQNPTQCFSAPGTYDVLLTVTTDQGCSTSFVINNLITVYQHPTAAFSINPEVLISDNPTANFTNNSTLDVIMWNWDFGDGSYSTVENPVHMYGDTGVYCITLTVSTANGCSSSVVNCLYIFPEYKIFIPNTFTPNDDKINDFFTVEGMGIAEFEMEIFNRWGESIYVTESMLGWPGTIGSTDVMAKQDVYVYKIQVITFQNDKFDYYGQINLIR